MSDHYPGNRPLGKTDMSCAGRWMVQGAETRFVKLSVGFGTRRSYLHLCLAGIAVVKLRINILHLVVLLLAGNCKRSGQRNY